MIKVYLDRDFKPTTRSKAKFMQVRAGQKVMFVVLKKAVKADNGKISANN